MKHLNPRGHRSAGRILALSAFVFALAMGANAQWEVIYLHPGGATMSGAYNVGDGQQVGYVTVGDITRAVLWTGSANSWVDLHPGGATLSGLEAVGDGQQVGIIDDAAGVHHAGLWTGTPESFVDLHPAWADASLAYGVSDGRQAGYAIADDTFYAGVWGGTADSWEFLPPAGAADSRALAMDGDQVVGSVIMDGESYGHASLWIATADSWVWVDLHPAGALLSFGEGVGDGQQVGYAHVGGRIHASLWEGSASSWVDLHPPGANRNSIAFAAHGGQQVGEVDDDVGVDHASLWSGTPESRVDLHAFLPSKFRSSLALGIWHDATSTYVVGLGHNIRRDREEALMWRADSSPPPPPPTTGTIEGRVLGPDGTAVKGALVIATDPDGNMWDTTSKGRQGSYSLTELPTGVYTVEGLKDGVGYGVLDEVPVVAGETTSGVDLYLLP